MLAAAAVLFGRGHRFPGLFASFAVLAALAVIAGIVVIAVIASLPFFSRRSR